jgi:hypothetical protein
MDETKDETTRLGCLAQTFACGWNTNGTEGPPELQIRWPTARDTDARNAIGRPTLADLPRGDERSQACTLLRDSL